jgi:hypothetical protein
MGSGGVHGGGVGSRAGDRRYAAKALDLIYGAAKQSGHRQTGERRAKRAEHGDADPPRLQSKRRADNPAQHAGHGLDVDRRGKSTQWRARGRAGGKGHPKYPWAVMNRILPEAVGLIQPRGEFPRAVERNSDP